jgi:hypothetical protein
MIHNKQVGPKIFNILYQLTLFINDIPRNHMTTIVFFVHISKNLSFSSSNTSHHNHFLFLDIPEKGDLRSTPRIRGVNIIRLSVIHPIHSLIYPFNLYIRKIIS